MFRYVTPTCTPAPMTRFYSPPNPRTVLFRALRLRSQRCSHLRKESIHTLDPARLQTSDYTDMGGQKYKTPPTQWEGGKSGLIRVKLRYFTAHGRTGLVGQEQLPFPPDAHGFLYYHPPTTLPPLDEGHLRFRITPSPDPATFSQGRDLLYPDGEPWNIKGGRIAITREYLAFRRMLLEDGLVTEAQLNEWKSCYNSLGSRLRTVMDDLKKPFVLDFAARTQHFWISSECSTNWQMRHPLTLLEKKKIVPLCTGTAICRFENAVTPKTCKRPRLALRLVKVLKPLQPSEEALKRNIAIRVPREGELFLRASDGRPWSRVIKARNHALYALWERWTSERRSDPDGVQSQGG
ncbi:hypothetical protein OF83DRAFT_1288109 [Amylostereum chailletii]|nr:hypothetical protein OF83DRAFT_1288109 [Amylostereum chailletii]